MQPLWLKLIRLLLPAAAKAVMEANPDGAADLAIAMAEVAPQASAGIANAAAAADHDHAAEIAASYG